MVRRLTGIIVLVVCMVLGAGVGAQPGTAQDLVFFLTFVPNIQFSPLYVAIQKGYFAEAGLNIIIQHGNEPDGVELIAAGQLKFGMISGEQVIQARAQGRPVVYVYEWFQEYPVGVVTAADSGIETVRDLAGRRVGIPGRFGASYSGLTAMLSASDMIESDLQLEPIDFRAPEEVCTGRVEAAVVYINNEPLQIEQRARAGDCGPVKAVRVLPVAEVADMVSNGIVTNEATIAADPELVGAVINAFDRGLRDVIGNPAEAYLLSARYVENLPMGEALRAALETEAEQQQVLLAADPDRAAVAANRSAMIDRLSAQPDEDLLQLRVLLSSIDLWDADRLGYSELSSWELTQQVLMAMSFVKDPIDLKAAFTNEFLPAGS